MRTSLCYNRAMKRLAVWVMLLTTAVALSLAMLTQSTHASVNDFYFKNFKADYYLSKDDDGRSTMRVVEEFTAVFPDFNQNKGVVRAIPRVFDGHPLSVHVDSLTRGGQPEPIYDQENQNHNLLVSTGDDSYVRGEQTYVLSYTLRDVIRDLGDHQELYWNTVGLQHDQAFMSVKAIVHLDRSVSDLFTGKVACYEGSLNSNKTCDSQQTSGVIEFNSVGVISAGQDMSLVMEFKQGAFNSYQIGVVGIIQTSLIVLAALISIISVIWAIVIRMRRGRDAPGRGIIVPEYLPPKQSIRLVADVVKKTTKVIPAQIISLAVAHKIRVIESDKKGLLSTSKKYEIELMSKDGLTVDENEFLSIFFKDMQVGNRYEYGAKDFTVGQALQKFQMKARELVFSVGLRRKLTGKASVIILSLTGLTLAWVSSIIQFEQVFDVVTLLHGFIVSISWLSAIIVAVTIGGVRPLTESGRELLDYVKGLEQYIKLAEADRLKVLQSPEGADKTPIDTSNTKRMVRLYERVLPYAVLLGQEKEWAKQLTIYYEQQNLVPSWYVGTTAFDMATFSSSLSGFSGAVTTFSAPSSSGGSGFSGGSGGGGGGGGFGGR